MLAREENERLCRIGPGAEMGALMREYWIPAMCSSELPGPDCDPVRVMLLGERLIAFRDSSGRVGLLPHACPHRGASLFFGRNEEDGLRCTYHGWKFDVGGRCVDMPNEPPQSTFKNKVRAGAYPCGERAGLVWAYMGPRETPPPMPHFEVFDYPEEQIVNTAFQYRCNWVQAMEGSNDLTHLGFLHAGHLSWEDQGPGLMRTGTFDRRPGQKIVNIDGGVMGAGYYRDPDHEANTYWAIGEWLFPFYSMVPTGELGRKVALVATVPLDDYHAVNFVATVQFPDVNGIFPRREYTGDMLLPNTSDWFGRFRWKQSAENDYLMDRDRQRAGESYTGVDGNIIEDVAITESMDPLVDRRIEHLATSDVHIIRIRKRLLAAAKKLAADGTPPPGVDEPDAYLVRAGTISLPTGTDWMEGTNVLRTVPDVPVGLGAPAEQPVR